MLICIGGFDGSGKRALAQHVAHTFGYRYYDIHNKKFHDHVFTKDGVRERVYYPTTDRERIELYRRIALDFPQLSRMYPDVVVDDVFNRAAPREVFFSEGRKYFDRLLTVWVESDDGSARDRLRGKGAEYEEWSVRRRELAIKEFQTFDPPIPVFSYIDSVEDAKEAFNGFLRKESEKQ